MSWFAVCLGALFIVLGTYSFCNGQDIKETEQDIRSGRTSSYIEFKSILEDPGYSSQDLHPLMEDTYSPGELKIQYDGIERILVGRILSYYRRFFNDYIEDLFNKGNTSFLDYENLIAKQSLLEATQQSNWWTRTWDKSLSEENGGSGPQRTIRVGKELSIIDIGEFQFTNTGQIRLGELFFYIKSTDVNPKTQTLTSMGSALIRHKDIDIFDYVAVAIKPKLTLKTSLDVNEILSNISIEAKFKIRTEHHKEPIVIISINTEATPMSSVASVKFRIEILLW